jgi:hypothetical protein
VADDTGATAIPDTSDITVDEVRLCGIAVAPPLRMLKLIGSYAIARLLGFGIFGAIVIYLLLTLLT